VGDSILQYLCEYRLGLTATDAVYFHMEIKIHSRVVAPSGETDCQHMAFTR
jgi:hypothetical protein